MGVRGWSATSAALNADTGGEWGSEEKTPSPQLHWFRSLWLQPPPARTQFVKKKSDFRRSSHLHEWLQKRLYCTLKWLNPLSRQTVCERWGRKKTDSNTCGGKKKSDVNKRINFNFHGFKEQQEVLLEGWNSFSNIHPFLFQIPSL